jgi:hypothetical protein
MKAIDTLYNGYRFRSRLEARWAVFLDFLRVPYQYEPEGFDLEGLWYLPDFWLPQQRCWLEVKPRDKETDADLQKCKRLARATGHPVFMLNAEMEPLWCDLDDPDPVESVHGSHRGWHPPGFGYASGRADVNFVDGCCQWGLCPLCGVPGIDHCGQHEACHCLCVTAFRPARRNGDWPRCPRCNASDPRNKGGPHRPWMDARAPILLAAYRAARSARFEHGERPRVPR